MTDSISQVGRRRVGEGIAHAARTDVGGQVAGPQSQSGAIDDAIAFKRTEGVTPAGTNVADAKVQAAIARVGRILTEKLVGEGSSATFSAPGVAALMFFAANGTRPGAERDAYLKALGLDGLSMEQVNKAAADLAKNLAELGGGVKVAFANLAVSNSTKSGGFNKSFVQGAQSGIGTKVIDESVSNAVDLAARINGFIEENTLGLIKDFMPADAVEALIWGLFSCAAFEATLTTPFVDANELIADPGYKKRLAAEPEFGASLLENAYEDRDGNKPPVETLAAQEWMSDAAKYLDLEPWALREAAQHDVIPRLEKAVKEVDGRMKMGKVGGLTFLDNARFEGVMLPYGADQNAFMVVMQPKNGVTPKQLLADVGTEPFKAALSGTRPRPGFAEDNLQMSAFKTKFKPDGALEAFGAIAPLKFNGLTAKGPASPTGGKLEAVIEFSARKTKAGQAAGVFALESAAPQPPPPKTLVIDKSFAYAIVSAKDFGTIWQGVQTVEAKKA